SITSNAETHSLLINPAGLAFESALNGWSLGSGLSFTANRGEQNSFSGSLGFGPLALAYENLGTGVETFNRYNVGLAVSPHPILFLGTRYRWTTSSWGAWDGIHSWDLGAQVRPSDFWTIALQLNQTGPYRAYGKHFPAQLIAGMAL